MAENNSHKHSLLYTRTGDKGQTSLVGGQRVAKTHPRLEAYGTVDELNSYIGLLASYKDLPQEILAQLQCIQNKLFNLGAYLATDNSSKAPEEADSVRGLGDEDIAKVEGDIDHLDSIVPPLKCFILPGGVPMASTCHVCRTICRRAERRILALAESGVYIGPTALNYFNRLSDYFFILARYLNYIAGVEDIAWRP